MSVLSAPPGRESVPDYDSAWIVDGRREPFLRYAGDAEVKWSDELEMLHEETSRSHFIDVWTREALMRHLGPLPDGAVVADLGCSTGYLLEDLIARYPQTRVYGVDLVAAGLPKAHLAVPAARLVQADVCNLPFTTESVDAIVSANLLEHVPDDTKALAEAHRVLRASSTAAFVVPAGPSTYDYYDRFLGHERRYARGELATKARDAGFDVVEDSYIASLLYPAFWLVKQRNRRRHDRLQGDALEQRVADDMRHTRDSRVGRATRSIEQRLPVRLPFGIRNLVAVRKVAS